MTAKLSKSTPETGHHPARRPVGRPTRADAEQLRGRILDIATELLLSHGYGATSIEAIARRARVSKRTFYHRFKDKPALVSAVVTRLIDGFRPAPGVDLTEGQNLYDILVHIGSLILQAALSPRALALHRLIVAESARFPELAAAVASAGGRQEAVNLIGALLSRHRPQAVAEPADAAFAAQHFLQMVVSLPQLRALGLGAPMTQGELETWVRDTVALFLGGLRVG